MLSPLAASSTPFQLSTTAGTVRETWRAVAKPASLVRRPWCCGILGRPTDWGTGRIHDCPLLGGGKPRWFCLLTFTSSFEKPSWCWHSISWVYPWEISRSMGNHFRLRFSCVCFGIRSWKRVSARRDIAGCPGRHLR